MYHTIVERIATRAFDAVNRQDYDALIGLCRPDVTHRFGGHHALGGVRHDTVALRAWFERLGRVMPTLSITVTDLWVKGGPWNTVIVIAWTQKVSRSRSMRIVSPTSGTAAVVSGPRLV